MDWIHQNRVRNWLIVILLGLNVLTVSIIWMQTAGRNAPQPKEQGARASESVNLMKKVLDLKEGQAARVESVLAAQREESKASNDRLAELKRQLAEELFRENPDTSRAASTAEEIGGLQSRVEMIRFRYFRELLALCTPEQREALKPIVIEVFGQRPPRQETGNRPQARAGERGDKPVGNPPGEREKASPPPLREEKPAPPSVDEKLARYAERLKLSDEQSRMIRAVLLKSKEKGDELRKRPHPDSQEIEAAKERIRREEQESIMEVLTEGQKGEFARMISRRRE